MAPLAKKIPDSWPKWSKQTSKKQQYTSSVLFQINLVYFWTVM